MKTVIFDIDGTLADLTHRLHHVKNGNRRWDEFFAECHADKPIAAIIELSQIVYNALEYDYIQGKIPKYRLLIVSGRTDKVRTETELWLEESGIEYDGLYMRHNGDYRPDTIVKKEILSRIREETNNDEILFVVDDRPTVVKMWREEGLKCLDVGGWEEQDGRSGAERGLLSLMVGPSGAGKSTWLVNDDAFNKYGIGRTHIVSSDALRKDICNNALDQSQNDRVFAALHKLVMARLDLGLPCVVDATNIKRADRLKIVELARGGRVRYFVINRSMEEKRRDGGWRNELEVDLIAKHEQTFNSQMKDILRGDNVSGVEVIDLRGTL